MTTPRRIAIALNVVDPHPNHQDVFAGVLRYAQEHGDWQYLIDEHPAYRPGQRAKARGDYDGVIARADDQMRKRLKRMGVPMVSTWYQHHRPGQAGVYMDPKAMGQLAAEHLIGRGYRRFAVYRDPSMRMTAEVIDTIVERIEEEEMDYTIDAIADGETSDPAQWVRLEKAVLKMLGHLKPPVALIIDAGVMTRMLVELCQHRGLHVPQDVAVLCLRNPKGLLEIPPSISAIQDCYHKVGYEAAALLDRLMQGEPVPDNPVFIQPPGIAARASTDYFAVDDPLVAQALQYISKHLAQKIYVEDIADVINISVSSLYMRFEAAVGRTVGEEIRRLRINSARVMLSDDYLTIQQVADRAGFGSADVMTRVFKKHFGMTPAAFRQQQRQSQ